MLDPKLDTWFRSLVITWAHTTLQIPWPITIVWHFKADNHTLFYSRADVGWAQKARHKQLWQDYIWKYNHWFSTHWLIFPCSIMCKWISDMSAIMSAVKKWSDTLAEERYKLDISLFMFWWWRCFIFRWTTCHFMAIKPLLNISTLI